LISFETGLLPLSGDEVGRWRTFGERAVYDNAWVWLGQEAARVEWVPLASVPQMIDPGEIWSAGPFGGAVASTAEAALGVGVLVIVGGADHAVYLI
jgi:hypothetical protein